MLVVIHLETAAAALAFGALAVLFLVLNREPLFRAFARFFSLMTLGALVLLAAEFLPAFARTGELRPLVFRGLFALAPTLLLAEVLWRARRP